jgi:NAD(P)-dependent dehydrogenase (short-subunit alcohol dehydrogenase family)
METDKAIFITGGASGIGRATAIEFARHGWFVGLADVDERGMAETAAMLPLGRVSTHRLDVRNRAAWDEVLAAFAAKTGGRIHVLFNNAGVARGGAFADVSHEDHDLVIDVNVKGVINGAEAGFRYLRDTPGSCLLNTCSAAGLVAGSGLAVYAVSKFGVRALTEALEIEWAPHGIRVASLMPSFIDTPLLEANRSGTNESVRDSVVSAGLEITPVEEVAKAAYSAISVRDTHIVVGKTARRIRFMTRWLPGTLRKGLARQFNERNRG